MPAMSRVRKASLYNSVVFKDVNFQNYLFLVHKDIAYLVKTDALDFGYWTVEVYFNPSVGSTEIMCIEPGDVLFLKPQNSASKEILVQIDSVDYSRNGRRATLEVKRI
jgi:hypothetical protein